MLLVINQSYSLPAFWQVNSKEGLLGMRKQKQFEVVSCCNKFLDLISFLTKFKIALGLPDQCKVWSLQPEKILSWWRRFSWILPHLSLGTPRVSSLTRASLQGCSKWKVTQHVYGLTRHFKTKWVNIILFVSDLDDREKEKHYSSENSHLILTNFYHPFP